MASASTDAAEIRRRGRQRLIGAVAIVLLLVVFIPMLLDSEPRKAQQEPSLDIPSKENAPPLPPPSPAPPNDAKAAAAATDTKAAAAPADAKAAAPAAAEPESAAGVTRSAPPAKVATAESRAPSPRLEGFAVQVGAFRDETTLKSARDKLAAAGIPHYTERLDSASGGPLTRLRAGPFKTRQAADAAAAKLKADALLAHVVPLP